MGGWVQAKSWLLVAAVAVGGSSDAAAHDDAYEPHWVQTGEGSWVRMERRANPGGLPVVLCHGISSNHRFWDLEPGRSLAIWLHDRGYDVWNLDLRGHGDARRGPDGQRQRGPWSIDDYGTEDLPAAFSYVLEQSGAEALSYVGHSMGGMVLAVYLATNPDPPLVSAVVVGAPLDFRDPDALTSALLGNAWLGRGFRFLPTPTGSRALAALPTVRHLDGMLYNPDNLDAEARKAMLHSVVSPLYRGEVAQFAQVRDGEFRSADGATVYREQLSEVDVPIRFIAGRADGIAPPDRVWSYYRAVGSAEKDFVVASQANGMHGDYGHLDLGVGDRAAEDVFPSIEGWIREHR